jgi:hypothetical protein
MSQRWEVTKKTIIKIIGVLLNQYSATGAGILFSYKKRADHLLGWVSWRGENGKMKEV